MLKEEDIKGITKRTGMGVAGGTNDERDKPPGRKPVMIHILQWYTLILFIY